MNFWTLHKTKIMGAAVLIIQYLQLPGNTGVIEKHIGTSGLEILGMLFGIIIIIIGVVNGGTPPSQGGDGKTAGRLASFLIILVGSAIVGSSLVGCVGTRAAYSAADTLDKYAYVISKHYALVVSEAADYKEQGGDPNVVAKLQSLDAKFKPVVLELRPLAESFRETQDKKDAKALQAKLDEAVQGLNEMGHTLDQARGIPTSSIQSTERKSRWIQSQLALSLSVS